MLTRPTCVLGISAYYHDSAAALVRDGEIVAAAQEERFTRVKHDRDFPAHAVAYCLEEAGLAASDLDLVAYYDKPLLTFDRLLETYLAFAPRGFQSFRQALPVWLHEKLHLPREIERELGDGYQGKILFDLHHASHAASAFYPSPFEEAAIITVDGVGEWSTSTLGVGRGRDVKLLKELRFPHSLGLLYSAFTYYLGFKVNSGEYKLMGLAPYGVPRFYDLIKDNLIDIKDDGSFHMDMRYFDYCAGLTMTNTAFHRLFGGEPREPEGQTTQRHMDIAASIQKATNEIMLKLARFARKETGSENLCMAGGVALNCVANGLILQEGIFKDIFIQPASGDAGGALGCALHAYHHYLGKPRQPKRPDAMKGSYLGPAYPQEDVMSLLNGAGIAYREMNDTDLIKAICDCLEIGMIVGLCRGRMEFGPRALGARTILGDPRNPEMQSRMNLKIKFREGFRPFAPAVLMERLGDYFDLEVPSPYMLLVAPVKESQRRPLPDGWRQLQGMALLKLHRSNIPAVTHVDFSARVQTVHRETNPFFHDLVAAFDKRHGCGVLVNTSFNVRGEPIVCTPKDAMRCFVNTEMDALAVGNCLVLKSEQQVKADREQYLKEFALD
ncbi:MAG: carbamoyltransferase [Elusimicrobia bacterium]|nr:carbamoyltransferase [Elusimicrobiota bacterium]